MLKLIHLNKLRLNANKKRPDFWDENVSEWRLTVIESADTCKILETDLTVQ